MAESTLNEIRERRKAWWAKRHASGVWEAWLELGADFRSIRRAFLQISHDGKVDRVDRAKAAIEAGNGLSEVGRDFEALDLFSDAIRLNPDDPMARGSRGITLAELAPFFHTQGSHTLLATRALDDLTFALAKADELHAVTKVNFERWQERMTRWPKGSPAPAIAGPYEDPYAEWCFRHGLLLTPLRDFRPPPDELDRLHIKGLTMKLDDLIDDPAVPAPFEAMNALKRDYLTARLLAWTALAAPDQLRLAERSKTAHYVETLDYATWDLGSGLAATALASAVDVADKVGVFMVMWLMLPQPPDKANDRNWCLRPKGAKATLATELTSLLAQHADRLAGLLGLVDLSRDQDETGSRRSNALRALRDAATHRFLAIRLEGDGKSTDFVRGVSYSNLERALMDALAHDRRLLLQLSLAISEKEGLERKPGLPGLTVDKHRPIRGAGSSTTTPT